MYGDEYDELAAELHEAAARHNRSARRLSLFTMVWATAWACWCAWMWHRGGGWWAVFYMALFFLDLSLALVSVVQWRDARRRAADYA